MPARNNNPRDPVVVLLLLPPPVRAQEGFVASGNRGFVHHCGAGGLLAHEGPTTMRPRMSLCWRRLRILLASVATQQSHPRSRRQRDNQQEREKPACYYIYDSCYEGVRTAAILLPTTAIRITIPNASFGTVYPREHDTFDTGRNVVWYCGPYPWPLA